MNNVVTIVLPVRNVERTLKATTYRILEIAEACRQRLRLVIVDDGSTDDTYDAACEAARLYPQICVFRQPFPRGLGPALDQVRRRLAVDQVLVHDGASPIDLDELAAMVRQWQAAPQNVGRETGGESRGSRRFAAVTALNSRMAEAHRSAAFHWLRIEAPLAPRRHRSEAAVPGPVAQDLPMSTPPVLT